ncbi:MAG: hypothetical protein EZS28_018325 [Streblomastix strix]|uniref:Uncharacterized protein n=1 Tax=Streblomastix strix TaxID=222440 RepID=A0A5J4VVC8_9EUKA|nr:MAG: hypothetical protein EZS28_018325 [Streblomastix strix]
MKYAFVYITVATVIFQTGSIITYSTPSNVSALWFSSDQRILGTMISTTSATLGAALDYFVTPFLVKIRIGFKGQEFHGNMPVILYGELVIQSIIAILLTIYFPAAPKIPPSYSENYKREQSKEQNKFVVLLLYSGIQSGASQSYNDNATYLLTYLEYSQTTGGIVSSIITVSAVIGGIILPLIMRILVKKDKFVYFVSFLLMDLALSALGTVILGLNSGLCYSLFFETAAEIAFPVPEDVSGTVLTFANNFMYFIDMLVYGLVGAEWTTFIALVSTVVSTVFIPFSKVSFKRSALEDQERAKEQNSQSTLGNSLSEASTLHNISNV